MQKFTNKLCQRCAFVFVDKLNKAMHCRHPKRRELFIQWHKMQPGDCLYFTPQQLTLFPTQQEEAP